jgi:hypothetical protein
MTTREEREAAAAEFDARAQSRAVHISRLLDCLADELGCGRKGTDAYSVWLEEGDGDGAGRAGEGNIMFRARKKLWDTGRQKWIVLDGTAKAEELRCILPELREVPVNVARNMILFQLTSHTYSKHSTITKGGKPTELLKTAGGLIQMRAEDCPGKVAAFVTKAQRRAMTGEGEGKLSPYADFRGALLSHFGGNRGSNAYGHCKTVFLVGRGERFLDILEAEMRALHYDTPTPLIFVPATKDGLRRMPIREVEYQMRHGWGPGEERRYARVSYHPDPRGQARNEATREGERLQSLDRLRPARAQVPIEGHNVCSQPLPGVPVDWLVTEREYAAIRGLWRELDAAAPSILLEDTAAAGLEASLRVIFSRRINELVEVGITGVISNKISILGEGVLIPTSRIRGIPGAVALFFDTLHRAGWGIAQFRIAGAVGAPKWSLFVYRLGVDPAAVLARVTADAKALGRTSEGDVLEFAHVDGSPFGSPFASGSGDPQLDRALAICAERGHALSHSPTALAGLPGGPWPKVQAAKDWKRGGRLALPPPPGWTPAEYRLTSQCRGPATGAWVPEAAARPGTAIARALGVAEAEVVLADQPIPSPATQPGRGPAWADLAATWADAPALIWDVTPVTIATPAVAPKGARQPDEPPPPFIQLPYADTSAERAVS